MKHDEGDVVACKIQLKIYNWENMTTQLMLILSRLKLWGGLMIVIAIKSSLRSDIYIETKT